VCICVGVCVCVCVGVCVCVNEQAMCAKRTFPAWVWCGVLCCKSCSHWIGLDWIGSRNTTRDGARLCFEARPVYKHAPGERGIRSIRLIVCFIGVCSFVPLSCRLVPCIMYNIWYVCSMYCFLLSCRMVGRRVARLWNTRCRIGCNVM